jgi:hypothetical protein
MASVNSENQVKKQNLFQILIFNVTIDFVLLRCCWGRRASGCPRPTWTGKLSYEMNSVGVFSDE